MEKESPLASRLRPETLDDIVGQQHILGKDKLLYLISIAVCENGPSYDIDVYLDDVTSEQGEENFREANAILEKAKKIIGGKEDVA